MIFSDREWRAKWIGTGVPHLPWNSPSRALPYLRRCFQVKRGFRKAVAHICAPGWMECEFNGRAMTAEVLQPSPSQFESVVNYVDYDVTPLLRAGKNTVGVLLGNGWYCCGTVNAWHFEHARWKDYPKLLFELEVDGETVLVSDGSWQCLKEAGPVVFSELRNGETYDARREIPGWSTNGFDASGWESAQVVSGPGGRLVAQHQPGCVVHREFAAEMILDTHDGGKVYALAQNIAGWARIRVRGVAGAQVKLIYGEKVDDHVAGYLDRSNDLTRCTKSGEFQTDRYVLKGEGVEEWHPRFTYHGFQYVRVEVTGEAEVLSIVGCAIRTGFAEKARMKASDPMLTRVLANNWWSFVNNYVGVPTDCPQREKNSWLGDAMLAAESGITCFDLAQCHRGWLSSVRAAQWPNGLLPGMALNPGWGYTWGAGSGDYILVYLPWLCYLYEGDRAMLEENWEAASRLMEYLESIATGGLVRHGLGDWFHPDIRRALDSELCGSMEYYGGLRTMAKIARVLGRTDIYTARAEETRQAVLAKWYRGGGHIGKDEMTALGLALFFGIIPAEDQSQCAALLDRIVRDNCYRPDCGALGMRTVPRALADNGYAESAWRLLMQPAFPGYVDMVNHGATTLWEDWEGRYSRNHVMIGDVLSWAFTYLGGIRPQEDAPGFAALTVRPFCPAGLERFSAARRIPAGEVEVAWRREDAGQVRLTVAKPAALSCRIVLPDGRVLHQRKAKADYTWRE